MSTSSVPKIEFTEQGLSLPTEADILAGVYADYNAAFGGNLNPNLETPQGQLISSTAAIIADANNEFANYVGQVDPDTASGFMQDAIAKIYFLDRKPATSTVVECELGGVPGTVIPAGSLASDSNGNIYQSLANATIGLSSTVTTNFANLNTGPIACPADTLTQIYRAVTGWDSITNADAGALGSNVESRADFEYRRKQSVAINALGTIPSIYAAVASVDNVTDVYVTENDTNGTISVGATSYSLVPHSLYVCALGGNSADIAKAIWLKKSVGSSYNGNTEVVVTDDSYSYPQPTYTVKYQQPDIVNVKFRVQIANNPQLPSNLDDLIKAAITSAFTGADGSTRARIGGQLFASRFYGAIQMIDARIQLISLLLGISSPDNNSISFGIDQAPTVSDSDITIEYI